MALLLGAPALLLAAWLASPQWILPRLDEWRPQTEARASKALGHPVQIGQITVRSPGWVPVFELRDRVWHDAAGREALRLPRVHAARSVPAMLALHLRFEPLLIDDARLDLRRAARGRWPIAGLGLSGPAAGLDPSRLGPTGFLSSARW